MAEFPTNSLYSLTRSFVVSITLHMTFGATSYALLHVITTSPHTRTKLPKGQFLTTSVEFECISTKQKTPVLTKINDSSAAHSASVINTKVSNQKPIQKNTQPGESSSLMDIIPHPDNRHPIYPEEARLEGHEANCLVKIKIRSNGVIHTSEIINDIKNCPAIFRREAKKTISMWRFSAHRAEYVEKLIPIKFKLE
jgi:TonB family protein